MQDTIASSLGAYVIGSFLLLGAPFIGSFPVPPGVPRRRSAGSADGMIGDGAVAGGNSGVLVERASPSAPEPGPGAGSFIRTACNACSSRSGGSVLLMKA